MAHSIKDPEENQASYASPEVIEYYDHFSGLQKTEKRVIDILGPELGGMRMLDVGIGGGRTTAHFLPLVKHYTGIDYVPEMVEVCRTKYGGSHDAVFEVADARDLKNFEAETFDFVLISFNAIDSLSFEGRAQALFQMHRVLKPGGKFVFSTHNIQSIPRFLRLKFDRHPVRMLAQLRDKLRVRWINREVLREHAARDFVLFNDGCHGFTFSLGYVNPRWQLERLAQAGFEKVRIFSDERESELSEAMLMESDDFWIYFLASKKITS